MFLFSHLHLFSAGCHTGKYRIGIKGLSMLPFVLKVGLCCPWTAALGLLESLRIHWKSWLSNSRSILLWLCKFNTVGHHHFLMPWKHCPMCDWSSVSIPGLSSWLKHLKMIVFIYFGGTCMVNQRPACRSPFLLSCGSWDWTQGIRLGRDLYLPCPLQVFEWIFKDGIILYSWSSLSLTHASVTPAQISALSSRSRPAVSYFIIWLALFPTQQAQPNWIYFLPGDCLSSWCFYANLKYWTTQCSIQKFGIHAKMFC